VLSFQEESMRSLKERFAMADESPVKTIVREKDPSGWTTVLFSTPSMQEEKMIAAKARSVSVGIDFKGMALQSIVRLLVIHVPGTPAEPGLKAGAPGAGNSSPRSL
jgi:hypothetical protein